jgi:hypothetical protein
MSSYILGYGSLLNLPPNKKSWPVKVHGLKRSLNVAGQQHLLFGVKDVPTAQCNGLLFKVNAAELDQLLLREKLYTLKPLAKERIEFYNNKIKFQPEDKIFCFYPQAKYVLSKKELATKPISKKYLNTCLEGAAAVTNPVFLADFLKMSHGL